MIYASIPTLSIVIIAALVDSINPCAIGVLILLMSVLVVYRLGGGLLKYGVVYIFSVFIAYLLAGLGLLYFTNILPTYLHTYLSLVVGVLIVALGLIEIKDFFWYGRGISLAIPGSQAKKIYDKVKKITLPAVMLLGIFVAGVELPCSGAPYLGILVLLSQNFNLQALMLLIFYNVIFVMPLLVMLLMVYFGTKIQYLKRWKQNNRAYMRLAAGIVLILLGWLLILTASGAINLN